MIYISFDTEEFDLPLEKGVDYNTLKEGVLVSKYGIENVLQILSDESVKATFFCTSNFVLSAKELVRRIVNEGHEIASHGCDHWEPKKGDALRSKTILEDLLGVKVLGYRQPRMFPVDNKELAACGYHYNSSLNPTFIPGRYSHLTSSRLPWIEDNVVQIPTSVSPYIRVPMFWFAFHHYPFNLYLRLVKWIIKHDNNFNTYFHPWEFYPLKDYPYLKIPYVIRRKTGTEMYLRFKKMISILKSQGELFGTYNEYANELFK